MSETKATLIYNSAFFGLPELYIYTDKNSGFNGWLMLKNADGGLVSLADLKPHFTTEGITISRSCLERLVDHAKGISGGGHYDMNMALKYSDIKTADAALKAGK